MNTSASAYVSPSNIAKTTTVKHSAHVLNRIWFGNMESAQDMDFLGDADITVIVNLSGFDLEPIEDVDIYNVWLMDNELLETEVDRAVAKVNLAASYINAAVNSNRNVLVYCRNCYNLSPFAVAYYLIKYLGHQPASAIECVKKANETRDLEPMEEYVHEDGRKEIRCRTVRTLINQSFRKLLLASKR
jgi:hypothetical protein